MLPCFERGTSGGGKGYSIGIPPELCADFLPSDKSSQGVTAKREGRGGDGRVRGREEGMER